MSLSDIKAVICDIDGTAMPNLMPCFVGANPSERVIVAVKNAQKKGIAVSCATGRNDVAAERVINALELRDPCIVGGGSQIVDPKSGNELWSMKMSQETVAYCLEVLAPYKLKVLVDGDSHDAPLTADKIEAKSYRMLDVQMVNNSDLPQILEKLGKDTSIAYVTVHSSDENRSFLHITDKLATKEYAVLKLQEILKVDKSQTAGVGDGLNDLELFKSVGLKVAMGNAVQELKDAADMTIDSVEDDGLAKFLESL